MGSETDRRKDLFFMGGYTLYRIGAYIRRRRLYVTHY